MLLIKQLCITRGQAGQTFKVCLPELKLEDGEIVSLQGRSGCGKSTLLEAIGLILRPEQLACFKLGRAQLDDDLTEAIRLQNHQLLAHIRAKQLGFMLQAGGLLPFLTVRQNIELSCKMQGSLLDQAWLEHLVSKLDIMRLLDKYPKQLSIGERQRAAFIRSVIHKPSLLLADEPTAALDPHNAETLFALIVELARCQKISTVLVTHDWELARQNRIRCLMAEQSADFDSIFLPYRDYCKSGDECNER